jgi:hypothetical protein
MGEVKHQLPARSEGTAHLESRRRIPCGPQKRKKSHTKRSRREENPEEKEFQRRNEPQKESSVPEEDPSPAWAKDFSLPACVPLSGVPPCRGKPWLLWLVAASVRAQFARRAPFERAFRLALSDELATTYDRTTPRFRRPAVFSDNVHRKMGGRGTMLWTRGQPGTLSTSGSKCASSATRLLTCIDSVRNACPESHQRRRRCAGERGRVGFLMPGNVIEPCT